jgi:beta-lactamase regulating signal transducer with metallopeptidase domain
MPKFLYLLLENAAVFTALFAGVLLVKRVFGKRLSAGMHLLLWGVVLLKLVIPVSLTTEWSPVHLLNGIQSAEKPAASEHAPAVNAGAAAPAAADPDRLPAAYTVAQSTAGGYDPKSAYAGTAAPSAASGRPFAVDWDTLLPAVWLAGVAASLLLPGIKAGRLKRKVMLCRRKETPEWLNALAEECGLAAGVRGRVGIAVQDILKAPAVMGVFRRVLILPASLVDERDEERLRHVLLHELCHCRRNDMAAIWILNTIGAAYWYNPLVPYCIRLIRRDMETACDARTLRILGREKRKAYIETILYFSMKKPAVRLKAALSLNDGCTEAKKRIEGMFLKRRTKPSVKFAVIVLALTMAFAGFTSGCQPTPEKPIVVNKADGELERKITASAAPEGKYEAPDTWEDAFFKDKLFVEVDAKIGMPDVTEYPVMNAEQTGFTQEQTDTIIKCLMQGKTMYNTARVLTKAELQQRILDMKTAITEIKSGSKKYDNSIEDFEEEIALTEKEIKTAPEKAEITISDGRLRENSLQVAADLGKKEDATLVVGANPEGAAVLFVNGTRYYTNHYVDKTANAKGLKTTREEAVGIAAKLLKDMGIDYMDPVLAETGIDYANEANPNKEKQGYAVTLMRTVKGIPTTCETIAADVMRNKPSEKPDFRYMRPNEAVVVNVDDTGVTSFDWEGPLNITGTAAENANLIPFDEVKEVFKKNFLIKYAPDLDSLEGKGTEAEIVKRMYRIDRIVFGMAQIQAKDRPGEYLLAPVWKFCGSRGDERDLDIMTERLKEEGVSKKDMKEIQKSTEESNGKLFPVDYSFLTINALDGSVIDLEQGY